MMTHAGPPRPWWGQEGPAGAQPAGLLGLEGRFSSMGLGTTTATVAVATAPLPADKPRGPGAAPQLLACHGPAAAAAVTAAATACDGPGMDRTSPTTVLLASPPGSGCSTPAACSPPTAGPGGAGLLAGGPGSGAAPAAAGSSAAAAAAGEQAPQRLRPGNGAASAPPLRPSGGGPSGPVKEVTVDSLVKAVLRARSGQPVVEAVREGLYCLDGRAVAALLKELAKNGLQYAASELFDWLRALPPNHQLSRLVDVYTYTTIISQCGSHQQLRKALELVAEMRGKGVPCNVHTFSALMSVCVKCNECELALDVYSQLQAEGCTPNMVTYNILIDIHSKSGNWGQAVAVLDEIRGQGLALEARTYNTVITACSKTGQPREALKVYERMLTDGVNPTGTTYTSLISAYGKAGQVEEALQVYEDMRKRGCECNVITYSSLISACERAGRWEAALQLFGRMLREECRPNVVTYNALLGACGNGGALDKAGEVFEHMVSHGCRPDAVTFSVLISAYERGGQWGKALQTLERMQQHGFRPDACVYNCVLNALWNTGLGPAKAKAVQLFQFACRQGHLRIHASSSREFTAVAHTYCTCLLVLLRWLSDCRELLSPLAPRSNAFPTLSLHMLKGKHSRPDQSYGPIRAALQRMAHAFSIPLALHLTEQGLTIQAEPLSLAAWLATDSSAALLQSLAGPRGIPQPSGSLLQADLQSQQQCGRAFGAVQEFEAGRQQLAAALPTSRGAVWQSMIDFIVQLAGSLHVSEETTHDTLQLCDRLLGALSAPGVEAGEATPLAAALLLLKCRQAGEAAVPLLSDSAVVAGVLGLPAGALAAAEARVLGALQGDLIAVSALRVLQLYLERLGCSQETMLGNRVLQLAVLSATDLLNKAALTPVFYQFQPSTVAAACLCRAREGLGLLPTWPGALQAMTGYSLDAPESALRECLELMAVLGLGG